MFCIGDLVLGRLWDRWTKETGLPCFMVLPLTRSFMNLKFPGNKFTTIQKVELVTQAASSCTSLHALNVEFGVTNSKVAGHIPTRVWMPPPMGQRHLCRCFYLGLQKHLSRCFYRSQRYQHSTGCQRSVLEIQPMDIPCTLCASVGHSTRFPLKIL
jgi:hypothetical protein